MLCTESIKSNAKKKKKGNQKSLKNKTKNIEDFFYL